MIVTEAVTLSGNDSRSDMAFDSNTTDFEVFTDDSTTTSSSSNTTSNDGAARGLMLDELKLVKVIVLVVVIGILLLSSCTFVFRTFSFSASTGKRDCA